MGAMVRIVRAQRVHSARLGRRGEAGNRARRACAFLPRSGLEQAPGASPSPAFLSFGTGVVTELTRRILAAGVIASAAFLLSGCAGPFNQVTPCVINCAVTLQGSPATAQQPAPVVIERKP